MEKKNQTSTQLVFSEAEKEIAMQLFHVNQLSPWKLSDEEILAWTKSILEQFPNTTPEKLKGIIDKFKRDDLHWDNQKGVQNILNILKPYQFK